GIECERPLVVLRGFRVSSLAGQDVAEEIGRPGRGPRRRGGDAELALRSDQVAARQGDLAESPVRFGKCRVQPERRLELLRGLSGTGRRGEGIAQIQAENGHAWLEADGLLEVGDRLVDVAAAEFDRSEIVPGA